MSDVDASWAVEVAAQHRVVMHLPSAVIGPVKALLGPGEYVSPGNGRPVDDPVVLVEDGGDPERVHSFVARGESFRVLSPAEVLFAQTATQALSMAVKQVVQFAASTRIDPEKTADLLAAILARQVAALAGPGGG